MKIRGRALGAWFNHLLFKLLPPRWYLRTQGIKLYREPRAIATITYKLHGKVKTVQIELLGGAWAIIWIFPIWLKYGFIEERAARGKRYIIRLHNILRIEWYDPVLKDYFSVS